MSDTVKAYGKTYSGINGFKVRDATTGLPLTYIRPQGTLTITTNGTFDIVKYASVNVNLPFQTVYSSSDSPSASLGEDGDVYLQESSVYKKVNGSWVEQSDLTTVFMSGTNYVSE